MVGNFTRRTFLKASAFGALTSQFPFIKAAYSDDGLLELRAKKSAVKLAGEEYAASDLWLYNDQTSGPEIRVTQGERVRIRFINELDEPSAIHWHGIRIENSMDGVPGLTQEAVKPGEEFIYDFEVPDAGTFWYHAHNKSWEQVARGLYGPLIVDEHRPLVDQQHDITLVIDDWRLTQDGSLDLKSMGSLRDWSHAGRLGNWLTVNGQSQPTFRLNRDETYRLRLINAANARILQIDPKAIGAKLIGYDGFVFDNPRDTNGEVIAMTPAQRMDLLITPTKSATKRLNDVGDFELQELSTSEALSIARFQTVDATKAATATPLRLKPNKTAEPDLESAIEISMTMSGGAMGRMGQMVHKGKILEREDIRRTGQVWAFNGVANLADAPLFKAKTGQTVRLTTINETGWSHGIHLHGHHFKVLKHNGQKPKYYDWRDTFTINRDETVEIAFVADNKGKWLLHCHMLEHAAAGMNTWFEVI